MNTMNPYRTTEGKPRVRHRYHKHAELGECSSMLRACHSAGLYHSEMAHVLTCRGIRSPGGSPYWEPSMVSRALARLGLGRKARAAE